MTYKEITKLLEKYNITTMNDLEYHLSLFDTNDECQDDPKYSDKNCMNAKCYEEYFVPDCRKILEIYEHYFQKEIKTKKLFIEYLKKHTSKSKSSIENYMSCKSCNQQIKKGIQNSLKISDSEFKKDFCKNLTIKFNYTTLFETDYISIKQFLIKEHLVTSDNFIPMYDAEGSMTKEEEKKLFNIVHTSKDLFKINLSKEENLVGSDTYLFNLAQYAFDRNLIEESSLVIKKLEELQSKYVCKEEFMQLKAKTLSSLEKDKEAIVVLKELIAIEKPKLDAETYSLLAASIKRDAFKEYEHYGDEKNLIKDLQEATHIYHSVYILNKEYYSALNYIYLNYMLAYLTEKESDYFNDLREESETIWKNTNHKIVDWWSFISNVEFLILIGEYEKAKEELKTYFDALNREDITEFNISSTLRQLNLYRNFCNDTELKNIIEFIGKV